LPTNNSHKKIILIDNYDSFTHILGAYLSENGQNQVLVYYNDEISIEAIQAAKPTHIVLSPGPGTPEKPKDFGICQQIITKLKNQYPILGVCLGHQGIIHYLGGKVTTAPLAMHGKTSQIHITKNPKIKQPNLFRNLPSSFTVMRYHSLIGTDLPPELVITAETEDKLPMGIQHRSLPLYGIQFHPESFQTEHGQTIISNFLSGQYNF
jgi:anthranilate synthase/aminodeoxychorismate synthase-like glutamine amidotransferase